MYKVTSIEIDGFWNRLQANCQFSESVNIIIGRNGTGKTTFMNILHSILTVDVFGLSENDFKAVRIFLTNGRSQKTIQVSKDESDNYPVPIVNYQISQAKWRLRLIGEDRRYSPILRKKFVEEANSIREELDKLVAVSSLSVYRLRSDDDYEVRDRYGSKIISPVDYRLNQALLGLTQFQLRLAKEAQTISANLQKDVLASILYAEEDTQEYGWNVLDFDKEKEQSSLVSAYTQLNSIDSDIRKKIRFHVSSIDQAVNSITAESYFRDDDALSQANIKAIEALRKTRKIIKLALAARDETQKIYSQIDLFLETLGEFISDKEFAFGPAGLSISNNHGPIDNTKLSSGEKQLIILMVEALLQDQAPHIFLADEPELSLHIAWQRQILPAIQKINPNSQIIVATHSPEVAARYSSAILDMEDLVHE
jgi:predicted ATPase